MKKKSSLPCSVRFAGAFFVFLALSLPLSGLEIGTKEFSADVSEKGGALKALTLKGKMLVTPGQLSVTDYPHSGQGNVVTMEDFGKNVFTLTRENQNAVTAKARGQRAFPELEMEKRYVIDPERKTLTVTWTLRNASAEVLKIAHWTKTFCRRDDALGTPVNEVLFPAAKGTERHQHRLGSKWMFSPAQCWMAVYGMADKTGLIMETPRDCTSAAFVWFSGSGRPLSTMEFFTNEFVLPPGGERQFSMVLHVSEDVPGLARNFEAPAVPNELPGSRLALKVAKKDNSIKVATPKYAKLTRPGSFSFTIPEQQLPSLRAVAVEEGYDLKKLRLTPALPFRVEGRRVLIAVPGLPGGNFGALVFRNGHIFPRYAKEPKDLGPDSVTVTFSFDGTGAPSSAAPGDADVAPNGSFETHLANKNWPAGYPFSELSLKRGQDIRYVAKDAPHGKHYLRAHFIKSKWGRPELRSEFRAEPGMEYTLSALVRFELPVKAWGSVQIRFYDAGWKPLSSAQNMIFGTKDSTPWREVRGKVIAPEGAFFGRMTFNIHRVGETVSVDKISIVPADYKTKVPDALQIYRKRLKEGWIPSLDTAEQLDPTVYTPHVKWFADPAKPMPEILFCCHAVRTDYYSFWGTAKRQIVEFANRYPLKYRFLPLFTRLIDGSHGYFGVNARTYAPELDDYSMELMRRAAPAKAILVSAVNFKTVQEEFVELLAKQQRQGAGILFLNCKAVPEKLLGKKLPFPPGLLAVPRMRQIPDAKVERHFRFYDNRTAIADFNDADLMDRFQFPGTPESARNHFLYNMWSFDFPDWEYITLAQLKALRYVAGVVPDVTVGKVAGTRITFDAAAPFAGTLKTVWKDLHDRVEGESVQPLSFRKGANAVNLQMPQLPGGEHIAEYRVLNAKKQTVEAGALLCRTKEEFKLKIAWAAPDRCFAEDKPVEFTVSADPVPAKGEFECLIYDSRMRLVSSQRVKASAKHTFRFTPVFPLTTIYTCFITLKEGGKRLARRHGEFSLPFRKLDLKEMHSQVSCFFRSMFQLPELGFDMVMTNFRNGGERNVLRTVRLFDMMPHTRGSGFCVPGSYQRDRIYRDDKPSDPVRDPCFTSERYQKLQHDGLVSRAKKDAYRYYNVTHHTLGDESFLGSTVCYSPTCLRDFRLFLKGRYRDLAELNKRWGTSFDSWEKVMPCQLNEIKDQSRLARWLEHKLFMSGVHARHWLGDTAKFLREVIPGTAVGLSGTQQPGYGYDWDIMMKHADFICYYSGAQGKMVQDFGSSRRLVGPCQPNCEAHEHDQGNLSNAAWGALFNGSNLSWLYLGNKMNGDLTPTVSLVDYGKIIRMVKAGPAKLILSAAPAFRETAVLYSQPSLFAAIATGRNSEWQNSYNGWEALLNDLGIDFRFLRSEELPRLDPRTTKALILPMTLCLSSAERKAISAYLRKGGKVIADTEPGVRDGHGDQTRDRIPGITLLDENLASYQSVKLGGDGGEIATVTTGAAAVVDRLRKRVRAELARAKVIRPAVILDKNNREFPCRVTLRKDKTNFVLGIYIPATKKVLDAKELIPLHVKLPVSGYVYDIRSGRELGKAGEFTTAVPPGLPALFTIQQVPCGGFVCKVPEKVARGEAFTAEFACGTGPQVFHARLIRPDGKAPMFFRQNCRAPEGKGRFTFQIAFDEPAGRWILELRHVSTGRVVKKPLAVR